MPAVATRHGMFTWADPSTTDPAVQRVRDAGGAVHVEPFDIGMGRIAVVADPQGAVFSLYNGRVDA